MKDKTWKLKYMRTELGALYIQVYHGSQKPVANIVLCSDNQVIILDGKTGEKPQ